jgi:hypothetical protein
MANSRDSYNLKKIQNFNKIDQKFDKESLKKIIIKSEKIDKPNLNIENIESLLKNKQTACSKELDECLKKRTNQPYKGIIKDFDYNKKFTKSEDLIVHKVTEEDKKNFENDVIKFNDKKQIQDKEIKDVYSKDKETKYKKEFEYEHKYKYRAKLDDDPESDLRTDRIEFYKKEQQKMEDSKKKIDDILINLIDSGVLSENLDSINYDKIDIDELEKTLKKEFGEEEFTKLLEEINK